jgi:hypothetical protein
MNSRPKQQALIYVIQDKIIFVAKKGEGMFLVFVFIYHVVV